MRALRGIYRLLDLASLLDWLRAVGTFFAVGGGAGLLAALADVPWWGFIPIGIGVGTLAAAGVLAIYEAQPRLAFKDPEIDVSRNVIGEPDQLEVFYVAKVAVYNEQESGERAIAKAVTPEVEIFDAGGETRLTQYVGWGATSQRDFHPNREEAHIYVAEKFADSEPYAVAGAPSTAKRLVHGRWLILSRSESLKLTGDRFIVQITLRGLNFRPVKARFVLINEGVGGGIRLEGG